MRGLWIVFLGGVLILAFAGCGGSGASNDSETLTVGLVPNQNPEEVQAQYEPLKKYLSRELDTRVELSVPIDYSAVVEAMASGKLDLAYFGGLTYVQARERADVHPLVTEINPRTHTTKYHSVIIVPGNSPIDRVEDLAGKDFAFGDVSSTSGSLYPSIMLREAGIDYRNDLGETVYTGGHDTTAAAVANGQVAAGGLEDRILYDLEEQGAIEKGSVRVIEKSAPIEGYPWVVRSALPDETKQEVAQAYLDMKDPELLDLLRAEGYERVQASDYDYVEKQARDLGLLTSSR